VGTGSGDKRAIAAIKMAISSPLLDTSIEGARGVLFNVMGGPDLTMAEIDEAASIITKSVDPDADIIFGAVVDDQMIDQIKVTLVATKFDEHRLKLFNFKKSTELLEDKEPSFAKAAQERAMKEEVKSEAVDLSTSDEIMEEDNEFDIPAFLRKK